MVKEFHNPIGAAAGALVCGIGDLNAAKTAEAKLDKLKAPAETAKASVEIKAIAELLTKKPVIRYKLQELKKSAEDQ